MGSSGSKDWLKHKDELIKKFTLAMCRAKLLKRKLKNELQISYHGIKADFAAGEDTKIKVEQLIYQEHNINAVEMLIKCLNLMITRKHLMAQSVNEELKPLFHSVIYCSDKIPIDELAEAAGICRKIYGNKFCLNALNNSEKLVDESLISHLHPPMPSPSDIEKRKEMLMEQYSAEHKKSIKGTGFATNSGSNIKDKGFDEILERVRRLHD